MHLGKGSEEGIKSAGDVRLDYQKRAWLFVFTPYLLRNIDDPDVSS
jgi:hypothetical protein